MTEVLIHRAEGALVPYQPPSRLEKIDLISEEQILEIYQDSLNRIPNDLRPAFEKTLLLFFRRMKKHGVSAWKPPWLTVNNTYWRAIVWEQHPRHVDRKMLVKWWCKADGGSWKKDTGYPRRNRGRLPF